MKDQAEHERNPLEEIQILIFNIMGIKLGIDTEQIYKMCQPEQLKEGDFDIFWFHEKIPFPKEKVIYESPKVILVRDEKITTGIIIDQVEDIRPIKIDSIQPLPPLIEASDSSGIIWGATLKEEEIILIVDLYRMMSQ